MVYVRARRVRQLGNALTVDGYKTWSCLKMRMVQSDRNKMKLEIWSKAQRESPGAVSPIGGKFSGLKFPR